MDQGTRENSADEEERWWRTGESFWRFLKKYTQDKTEARSVITGVREDNGWEAWRKLHRLFEPCMAMREALVMAQFTNMASNRDINGRVIRKS